MGYAMQLTRDVDNAAIDATRMYHYAPDRGPRLVVAHVAREPGAHPRVVRGSTLLALAAGSFPDAEGAADAKRLMRDVLDHHLDRAADDVVEDVGQVAGMDDDGLRRNGANTAITEKAIDRRNVA